MSQLHQNLTKSAGSLNQAHLKITGNIPPFLHSTMVLHRRLLLLRLTHQLLVDHPVCLVTFHKHLACMSHQSHLQVSLEMWRRHLFLEGHQVMMSLFPPLEQVRKRLSCFGHLLLWFANIGLTCVSAFTALCAVVSLQPFSDTACITLTRSVIHPF